MIRYELELSDAKFRRAIPNIFTRIKDRNEKNGKELGTIKRKKW